jgi:Tfp pilus assembly protein PilF
MDVRTKFVAAFYYRHALLVVASIAMLACGLPAHGQMIAGEVTVLPPYGYGYGYSPYSNWGWSPGGVVVEPWVEPWPIILPPLYLPAETMYGPGVMQRFMGVNVPYNQPRVTIVTNRPVRDEAPPEKAKPRISNEAARARADKFVQFGDAQFVNQRYHSAVERYKSAVQAAPDLPEPLFRQSFALVAMGKYDTAARLLRRGLLLHPELDPPRFVLDEMYQGNRAAKVAHLEALAQAIEAAPQTADLLLVLGMMLHFDGQPERAQPLFVRCAQLDGNEDGALDVLLPK